MSDTELMSLSNPGNKKKVTNITWKPIHSYLNSEDFKNEFLSQNWTIFKTLYFKNQERKDFYKCKINPSCKVHICVQYLSDGVHIFQNQSKLNMLESILF